MTPETIAEIKSWPNMSEEEAKLLFIRRSATEAFEKNEIESSTKSILVSIVEISTVSSMTREEIGMHIANLEKARSFLAAFTQGLMIGYANAEEPKIKAKKAKEQREKLLSKVSSTPTSKDKKVNDLIEMARSLSLSGNLETNTVKEAISRIECPTCHKQVLSLKFHKC